MNPLNVEPTKSERIEARVCHEDKELFRKAAVLSGRVNLTDFVVQALKDAAQKVIKEHKIIELTQKDQELFVKRLLEESQPSNRLIAATKRHNKIIKE